MQRLLPRTAVLVAGTQSVRWSSTTNPPPRATGRRRRVTSDFDDGDDELRAADELLDRDSNSFMAEKITPVRGPLFAKKTDPRREDSVESESAGFRRDDPLLHHARHRDAAGEAEEEEGWGKVPPKPTTTRQRKQYDEELDEDLDEDIEERDEVRNTATHSKPKGSVRRGWGITAEGEGDGVLGDEHDTVSKRSVDPLLGQADEGEVDPIDATTDPATAAEGGDGKEGKDTKVADAAPPPNEEEVAYVATYADSVDPEHNELMTVPIDELVERICQYQRATENPRTVSSSIEAVLYPVLLQRLNECSVEQLLDIVESPWARSTLVRHGVLLKDKVRDRIAVLAVDMKPAELLRALVVMGMSAGRRKRDVDFFRLLGRLIVVHVNTYKDPNDLQKLLTAFARAKIVPPPSFLALMGRRFAVLSKKIPLQGLPAYRAFINLRRMGYDQMNAFRFLADRLYEVIDENIKQEKIRLRTAEIVKEREAKKKNELINKKTETKDEQQPQQEEKVAEPKVTTVKEDVTSSVTTSEATPPSTYRLPVGVSDHTIAETMELSQAAMARRRFQEITELRPVMLTKLLYVLARLRAPHQQYLRPLIKPVILPCLPYFPPPSFTRLIRTLRVFRTPDRDILEPVVDRLLAEGPEQVNVNDLLEVLRILCHPDTPMLKNFSPFINLCRDVFGVQAKLRPSDMCAIASDLMAIQRKEEIPLESVEPLVSLMDVFAERMAQMMELGVLALTHAEVFEELCEQMHHPDAQGHVAHLKAARRGVNKAEGGDDDYYMKLDIDVRELFQKCVIVNHWNTHNDYRPVPGVVQVDFKQALAEVSLETVIDTAHLFEQAYPGRMRPTLRRYLARSALAKMSEEGEEFVTKDNKIEMRLSEDDKLFDAESLEKFANKLLVTPLRSVRNSPDTWKFVRDIGMSIGAPKAVEMAENQARKLVKASTSVISTVGEQQEMEAAA